ncbi:MAG: L-threonylcarbamoyladenylate synthase [Bryobacteraceae bacterium]
MITIAEAAERIRSGELVALPTETVYGLGANALDARAVAKIYAMKGRPATSPLIVHVDSIEMAKSLVREWPEQAERLARKYWPGPLTLVLPKANVIPDVVSAGLRTVGIRMPKHPIALELIRSAGVPIAAPSANKFMGLSPTTAQHVRDAFGDAVPVIDGGPCEVGIESTVVAVENGETHLLRPGMISLEDVERVTAPGAGTAHPAPGMHDRHYSPRTRLLLVTHPSQLPDRSGAYVWHTKSNAAARVMQLPADPAGYAARIYDALHELDREGWPWIAVESPPETGEWEAVLDRLRRAATK